MAIGLTCVLDTPRTRDGSIAMRARRAPTGAPRQTDVDRDDIAALSTWNDEYYQGRSTIVMGRTTPSVDIIAYHFLQLRVHVGNT